MKEDLIEMVAKAIVRTASEGTAPEVQDWFIERHWPNHKRGAEAAVEQVFRYIVGRQLDLGDIHRALKPDYISPSIAGRGPNR